MLKKLRDKAEAYYNRSEPKTLIGSIVEATFIGAPLFATKMGGVIIRALAASLTSPSLSEFIWGLLACVVLAAIPMVILTAWVFGV
jgi:hypothetical protein